MTLHLNEIHTTSALQIDSEIKKLSRSFQLYDDAGESISLADVPDQNDLPRIGDPHPDLPDLYFQSLSINKPSDGDGHVVAIQCDYANTFVEGVEEAFVKFSTKVSAVFLDAYRLGASLPSNFSFPAEEDILGTKIDMGGSPVSVQTTQQTLETTFTVESVPNFASLFYAAGKRNAGSFEGFPSGTLLYMGPTIDRIGPNLYQRRDSFVYDAFAHCRQVIGAIDLDGRAVLDENQRATTVFWKQPFSGTANFNNLGIPL